MHTHTPTCTPTCMHTCMHTHTCVHTHMHTHMHTHPHAHPHAHPHTHMHTCTHADRSGCSLPPFQCRGWSATSSQPSPGYGPMTRSRPTFCQTLITLRARGGRRSFIWATVGTTAAPMVPRRPLTCGCPYSCIHLIRVSSRWCGERNGRSTIPQCTRSEMRLEGL